MLARQVRDVWVMHGRMPDHHRPYLLVMKADAGECEVVIRWEQYRTESEMQTRLQEVTEGLSAGRYAVYYLSPRMACWAEVIADAGGLVCVRKWDATGERYEQLWCSRLWLQRFADRPEWWHDLYRQGEREIESLILPALRSGGGMDEVSTG